MIKFKLFGFGSNEETSPALPSTAAHQQVPALMDEPQTNFHGKKVLIVDDNPIFLKATATKLQSAGFQVRTAKEASGAIAALGESPADVILMDIGFPADVCKGGMGSWDGFQIISWLRGLPGTKEARFIMVSGSDSPANRAHARQLGAVAYFQKPLDHDGLFAVINTEH
jgi:CheY-like chemotaxis protein